MPRLSLKIKNPQLQIHGEGYGQPPTSMDVSLAAKTLPVGNPRPTAFRLTCEHKFPGSAACNKAFSTPCLRGSDVHFRT